MSAEGFDLANLAHWVRARRAELDLSHEDVADRGGPSTTKMSQIENEHPTPPRRDVLKKLDRALEWREGTARMVMLGEKPVTLEASRSVGGGREDLVRQIQAASYLSGDEKAELLATLAAPAAKDDEGRRGA